MESLSVLLYTKNRLIENGRNRGAHIMEGSRTYGGTWTKYTGRRDSTRNRTRNGTRNTIEFFSSCRKLAKGKTSLEIAEALEEPEDVIQELCEKAMEYATEYNEEKYGKTGSINSFFINVNFHNN